MINLSSAYDSARELYGTWHNQFIQGDGAFDVRRASALKNALVRDGYSAQDATTITYRCAASTLAKQPFTRRALVILYQEIG